MFTSNLIRHAKKVATAVVAATLATFSLGANASTTLTGQIQGTPIANARFVAVDASGKVTLQGFTTAAGKFSYQAGNTVSFYIGDILLGKTSAAASIPTAALVSGAKNADAFTNLTRFLQSMDSDLNLLNGVQIKNTAHAFATGLNVNFDAAMKTFEVQASLAKVLALAAGTPTLPQAVEALTNFRMALLNAYNNSSEETVLNLVKTRWKSTFTSTDCGTTTATLTHDFNLLGHVTLGSHNLVKRANGTCVGGNNALLLALYENDNAFFCANNCKMSQLNRTVTLTFPVAHEATIVHQPGSNLITIVHRYEGREVIETMVKTSK